MIDFLADKSYPEKQKQVSIRPPGCHGPDACGQPPLPPSSASWRSKISAVGMEGGDLYQTLALQYFPSIFIVSIVFFTNNSKPGFDDGLRLVIAPATKAQWNMENTGILQISQLCHHQEKLRLSP